MMRGPSLGTLLASFATVQSNKPDRAKATRAFVALHADPLALLLRLIKPRWFAQPSVLTFAALMLFAFTGHAAASAAPIAVTGTFLAKRTYSSWSTAPVSLGTSDMKLTRGMVDNGLVLSVLYSTNVTGAGAAVRTRSLPIKRVSLIGDNGKTIQSIKGVDLVSKAIIFDASQVGQLLIPASAATVANYTGLEAHVPIYFAQPHSSNGFLTALPTYAYQDLTLRVEWGDVFSLFTDGGTLAGTVTFTANGSTVTQLEYGDLSVPNAANLARTLRLSVDRYIELVQGAVASTQLEMKLGVTSDIRAIMITSELTSTGEPTDTIVNSLTFKENNTVDVFSNTPWGTLRADNTKVFGIAMPTGVRVIDFAEDGDVSAPYRATRKDAVSLFFNTAAIAGTIRAHLLTIEPPLNIPG